VPHFKSGKLRPIAVANENADAAPARRGRPWRGRALPGYAIDVWFGVLAPAGTQTACRAAHAIDRLIHRVAAEYNKVAGRTRYEDG